MLFEVAADNGARTHAGVLEFSHDVPEGVVLLPEKVQDSLWGLERPAAPDSAGAGGAAGPGPASAAAAAAAAAPGGAGGRCSGRVRVSYRRLEKGTYVRLQPELRAFHDEVGSDPDAMKEALEGALHAVCALTEGDWVQVRRRARWAGLGRGAAGAARACGALSASCCVGAGGRRPAGAPERGRAARRASAPPPPPPPRPPRQGPASPPRPLTPARCRTAARATRCGCSSCSPTRP
jgi:hypothetical protein